MKVYTKQLINAERRRPIPVRAIVLALLAVFVAAGCSTTDPYYRYTGVNPAQPSPAAAEPLFTLFLIGDSGSPTADPLEPNLRVLRHHLQAAGEHSAVVFLGDNIYSYGLRPEGHPERALSEQRINTQLSILEAYSGQAYFIPGNHDWNDDEPGGLEAIVRQQRYIEQRLGDAAFAPDEGCPGPVEVPLGEAGTLLMIDTEWWLYPHDKPGPETCRYGTRPEMTAALDSLVQAHADRPLMVAGHHPLYSNGTHAGYFPATDHLFPLLDYSPVLYIPLPVIGSINPLYRRHVGYLQDLAGGEYRALREGLETVFRKHPRLLYASGHDHSLQYHRVGNIRQVLAGSGTVKSYARPGKTADFVYTHEGFARLDFYPDRALLTFWTPEGADERGRQVYGRELFNEEMESEK